MVNSFFRLRSESLSICFVDIRKYTFNDIGYKSMAVKVAQWSYIVTENNLFGTFINFKRRHFGSLQECFIKAYTIQFLKPKGM